MKKTVKIIAAALSAAMIVTFLSAGVFADTPDNTEQPAAAVSLIQSDVSFFDETGSVWLAYKDGKVSSAFVFYNSTEGSVIDPSSGLGMPFELKLTGGKTTFFFGGPDEGVTADFKPRADGSLSGTFNYASQKVTYNLVRLYYADPKTYADTIYDAKNIFGKGVYAVYIEGKSGVYNELDHFMIFESDTEGYTSSADEMGIGLPFRCEQDGTAVMFHFASADDETPAVFVPNGCGGYIGTIDHGENSRNVKIVPMTGVTPKTFEARVGYPQKKRTSDLFKKGVYSATDGKLRRYFIFNDEKSGIMINAGEEVGDAFTCEQKGNTIVFFFGEDKEGMTATFKLSGKSLYGTFGFSQGDYTEVLKFKKVKNTDPDTFKV